MSECKLEPFEVSTCGDPMEPTAEVSLGHHDPEEFVRALDKHYEASEVQHGWWLLTEAEDEEFESAWNEVEEGTEGAVPVTMVIIP